MKKILPLRIAVTGSIIIFACTIVFHFLVIAGIIPSTIVWGGNLENKNQFYTMEAVSIAINAVMLLTVLLYSRAVSININRKIIIAILWLMFGLFVLNTIGNLMAKNELETYLFTPVTLILAIFCFRMAAYDDLLTQSALNRSSSAHR